MRQDNLFEQPAAGKERYKIKQREDLWIEESFGKNSWREKSGNNDAFLGPSVLKKKFLIVKILLTLVLAIIAIKAFYIQICQGAKYKDWAEANRVRRIPIVAERGIIYDRNQKALVENIPDFYLALTPDGLPADENEKTDLIQKISQIVNMPPENIEERLSLFSPYNYKSVPVKTNITYEEAIKLQILSHTYPAIQVETGLARKYDIPQSLSHIIGYLRKVDKDDLNKNSNYFPTDDIGKDGLEAQYENILRGLYGRKEIEVDALGRQTTTLAKEDPVAGNDLILSIDIELQKKVEEVLKRHMAASGVKRGAVIVSDVNTGEILAIDSAPFYDNNIFSGELNTDDYALLLNNPNRPLFDRAVSGEYPSGSTVKPIFAAAALEEGIITKDTTFLSTGGIQVDKWFFPDWKIGGHGITNVRKALAESINTFFYIIGGGLIQDNLRDYKFAGLGVAKLKEYAQKFGLNAKLGIDLPGEATGLFPDPAWKQATKNEAWYIGDTYHLAIGQGDLLVTPLQVNSWTATFANEGIVYRPHLVKTIVYQDGKVGTISPQVLNKNFIKPQNIETVRQGLRDGVLYGSSSALNELGIQAAGKTGTAQWGINKKSHAWFTGFAPYDKPEIAITVLMEEGGEGSITALPVAKEILWWYFNVLKH